MAVYVNGSLSKEYIYSGSALLATIEGGATKYHHQDHLSVRVTTDSDGAVTAEQGHYPFGESWYPINNTAKWQFTSYERDSESALDYAMFRYDSSRLGRFQTPDPIAGSVADPQSLNRYAYVRNDPVNLVDPLGLEPPLVQCAFNGIGCVPFCTQQMVWYYPPPGREGTPSAPVIIFT